MTTKNSSARKYEPDHWTITPIRIGTTTPAMWYNEMTIGAPKAQGGLGFFEEEGLEVEFTGASGSTAAVQLVGAGQADIGGHIGTAPTIIGVDQGLPIIAPWLITRRNIYAIVIPEDSRLTKLADLKGQKLGVFSLGSDGVPMAKAMVREVGLDPEKDLISADLKRPMDCLIVSDRLYVADGGENDRLSAIHIFQCRDLPSRPSPDEAQLKKLYG